MTNPHPQPRCRQIAEAADPFGVALGHEDHQLVLRDLLGIREAIRHLVHKLHITCKVGIRHPACLHLRDKNPTAVVDRGDGHSLACPKGRERLLDGRPQHRACVERELWLVIPEISLKRCVVVLLVVHEPTVGSGDVAGQMGRRLRLRAS